MPPELDRLELTIRRLLESHARCERRAAEAEARVRELEAALGDVSAGRLDPVTLAEEARALEERNAVLQERLSQARAAVDRIMGRLQFTAEDR
jgi:predicted RNase H-like nuclease (RuvC/YqgF family)